MVYFLERGFKILSFFLFYFFYFIRVEIKILKCLVTAPGGTDKFSQKLPLETDVKIFNCATNQSPPSDKNKNAINNRKYPYKS